MWFIKSELRKDIDRYKKDKEILVEFARSVRKPRKEDITLEDIKAFYEAVVAPKNSLHERNKHMKAIRKFFKYHRGENVLKWQVIHDDPLQYVGKIDILPLMKEEKKRPRGRPADLEMIKKIKFLIDEGGMTMRGIARAEGIDPKNVHRMYHYPKNYANAKFVGKKLSTTETVA
jgi:hypothetical protein